MKYYNIIILILMVLVVVPSVNATLTNDLVSYLTLDETSGTNVIDSVGNYNFTAGNEIIFTDNASGIINTSANFSRGSYSIYNTGISPIASSPITWAQWLYFPSTDTTHRAYFYQNSAGNNNRQAYTLNDEFRWCSRTSTGTNKCTSLPRSQIPTNEWLHFAFVENDTGLFMYINGTLNNSLVESWTKRTFYNELYIGSSQSSGGTPSLAKHDEVAIYSRSLSSDEILLLYEMGRDGIQYPFSIEPEPTLKNISVRLNDTSTGSLISDWTLFYNNETIYAFGTTETITIDENILYNFTYTKTGYTNSSYTNINFSSISGFTGNITPIPIEAPNMTNVSFSAVDGANNSISGFSVSVNDDEYFGSTSTDTLVLELPEDTINNTLYKVVYSKFGYYTSSYNDINLSSLSHEGTLVERSYIGDESLDDKAIIWILLAITGGIGASSIFARPMLVVFGFWLLFMTYFLSNNIMVSYYWFAPFGYVLGAIVILSGMLRLGFGEKF